MTVGWYRSLVVGLSVLAVLLSAAQAEPELLQSAGVAETYREAYDYGFSDGRAAALQDLKDGGVQAAAGKEAFERAEHGYLPERHDRNVYQVAYRRGFEDGYQAGLAGERRPTSAPASPRDLTAEVSPTPVNVDSPPADAGAVRVPAGTTVKLELLQTLSTRYNERGDPFAAAVMSEVRLGGATLIPKGSEVTGRISYLKRAGRIRGRAQISLRFERIRLPDGRQYDIEASLLELEERSEEELSDKEGTIVAPGSKRDDAGKVGKASGIGALVGVISGGKRGAGVGAAAGAVAGLATVLVTRGRDAELEARTQMTIRLTQDLTLPTTSLTTPVSNPDN